jgi:hypothetical protein
MCATLGAACTGVQYSASLKLCDVFGAAATGTGGFNTRTLGGTSTETTFVQSVSNNKLFDTGEKVVYAL